MQKNQTFFSQLHSGMIGHFTQLVKDDAFAVGCACTQTHVGQKYEYLLACDYSVTNIQNDKVYKSGPTGKTHR